MPREFAKIKDIYLRLYDYKFDHGPREENPNKDKPKFVGRKNIKKRLRLLFDPVHSKSDHGAYLVTGYRGMGKTSLVRESLSTFKKSGEIDTFEFFLSQDDVRDIDLLRQIGWKISDYVNQNVLSKSKVNSFLAWLLSILFFVGIFMGLLELFVPGDTNLGSFFGQIVAPYKSHIAEASQIVIALLFATNFLLGGVISKEFKYQILLFSLSGVFFLGFLILAIVLASNCEKANNFICVLSTSILLTIMIQGVFSLLLPGAPFLNRPYANQYREKYTKWAINGVLLIAKLTLVGCILYQSFRIFGLALEFLAANLSTIFVGDAGISRAVLFFILLAFVFGAANTLMSKLFMFLPSYKYKKELKELLIDFESRLYANVTQEKTGAGPINIGSNNPLGILTGRILNYFQNEQRSVKNTLNYQVASTKEIEQFLFRILRKIEHLRNQYELSLFGRNKIPKFVFVIDELDKVEPNYYFSPGDRETDEFVQQSESSPVVVTKARKRQEAIAKLLANLKSFLNNADAKFIFIGGRGMYDAALADIADRETFFSSIFNEVIYVPSFFRDSITRQSGLSELTEYFIAQYLVKNYIPKKDDEKPFRNFLKEVSGQSDNLGEKQSAEFFKIYHTLQNFFIFCAYRSNGSPKKLIEIFEKYVVELGPNEVKEIKEKNTGYFYTASNNVEEKQLFLKFSYKNQYEINLTSNLYRPYLIIHSRHMKSLGDKLLYSSAFLMDHILKFHRAAFSFRNLELIPDIILANKDPNLRHFFQDIMNFLSKMHIRETVNAIYQHKFYSRVKNELKYVSRISEFSSAAYNFTLDESYHLKSYYKKKLSAKYKEYSNLRSSSDYIHSIGYLHSIIGDLHYYDEEYDDAIIHYTDAIQPFITRIANLNRLQPNEFILYARCKLVLGLCLEKLQSYDKAYGEFRSLILESKNHGVPGLKARGVVRNDDWELPFNRMQIFLRPHIALLNVIEKMRADGITFDNLVRNIEEYIDFLGIGNMKIFPMEECNLIPNYELFDNKSSGSISHGTSQILLHRASKKKDKKRIVSLLTDYYSNVGDLLYFKNNIFYRLFYVGEFNSESTILEIKEHLSLKKEKEVNSDSGNQTSNLSGKQEETNKDYFPSASAYIYYIQALRFFMIPYVENFIHLTKRGVNDPVNLDEIGVRSEMLSFFLDEKHYAVLNATEQVVLANILSKLGNAVFACIRNRPTDVQDDFLKKLPKGDATLNVIDLFNEIANPEDDENQINLLSIERTISIYLLAYTFYKRAGRVHLASLQLKKILYLLRETSTKFEQEKLTNKGLKGHKLGNFILWVTNKILSGLTNITDVSNRAQIKKSRSSGIKAFENKEVNSQTAIIYNNHSTSPDVREVVLLVETIKSNLFEDYYESIKEVQPIYVGEFSPISDMLVRVFELKYQSEVEYAFLNKILDIKQDEMSEFDIVQYRNKIREKIEVKKSNAEEIKQAINNGFFCLYETIRILNTYGVDYILNYSFLAATHYRLGKFSLMFEAFVAQEDPTDVGSKIEKELTHLVGDNFLHYSDPFFHFDKSILYNQKAREMHSGGDAFQQHNRSMYSLDDDYNDEFIHFCASIERFRINIGTVRSSIVKANTLLKESFLREYDNYLFKKM